MTKNESDSNEVDASKDNSQVDASDEKGTSDNADDSGKSQDDNDDSGKSDDKDEKKQEEKQPEKKIDLEEETYKQRYANSTKEIQELKKDPAKLKEFLGLDPDASLDEHFGTTKKDDETSDDDDDEDSDDDNDQDEDKDDDKQGDDALPYKQMNIKPEEQAAIDLIWDNFEDKHEDIAQPKVREALTKNFFRFLYDEAGNRRKLKNALEDTYQYISMDKQIKKAQEQARNEAIIKTQNNKNGAVQSSSSKPAKKEPKNELSDKQKMMANKLGVSEEDYLKNLNSGDDEE